MIAIIIARLRFFIGQLIAITIISLKKSRNRDFLTSSYDLATVPRAYLHSRAFGKSK